MLALGAASCTDSDDDSSGDVEGAVQFFLEFADQAGVELDRACLDRAVETLDTDDLTTLADTPVDRILELVGEQSFSEVIDAVGERVFDECVTRELGQ